MLWEFKLNAKLLESYVPNSNYELEKVPSHLL
jgi:hypothetical protein